MPNENVHPIFSGILESISSTPKRQYNVCATCGAKDGRAGLLINDGHGDECMNCHDTRTKGIYVLHDNLSRTQNEANKTFDILKSH